MEVRYVHDVTRTVAEREPRFIKYNEMLKVTT